MCLNHVNGSLCCMAMLKAWFLHRQCSIHVSCAGNVQAMSKPCPSHVQAMFSGLAKVLTTVDIPAGKFLPSIPGPSCIWTVRYVSDQIYSGESHHTEVFGKTQPTGQSPACRGDFSEGTALKPDSEGVPSIYFTEKAFMLRIRLYSLVFWHLAWSSPGKTLIAFARHFTSNPDLL